MKNKFNPTFYFHRGDSVGLTYFNNNINTRAIMEPSTRLSRGEKYHSSRDEKGKTFNQFKKIEIQIAALQNRKPRVISLSQVPG